MCPERDSKPVQTCQGERGMVGMKGKCWEYFPECSSGEEGCWDISA